MPDSKITALASIGTGTDPVNDALVIVDVSDVSPGGMSATGTTKRVSLNNLLASSPTATLASATITGDLTVDTSTLKVDSANNRVGVGTASPAYLLDIADASFATRFVATNTNNSAFGAGVYLKTLNGASMVSNATLATSNDGTFNLLTGTSADSTKLSIGPTGIFTFQNVGGVAGTAMTLNATGLGVGISPSYRLNIGAANPTGGNIAQFYNNATSSLNGAFCLITQFGVQDWYMGQPAGVSAFTIGTGTTSKTEFFRIDGGGNVGIGVTPSASWVTYKALEFDTGIVSGSSSMALNRNCYFDGVNWRYKVTTSFGITQYQLSGNGNHIWNIASSGSAGAAINGGTGAWTQAMTLDASGNLLVGSTTSPNNSRIYVRNGNASSPSIETGGITGDVGQAGLIVGKFDNNSTTSQILVRFTINNNTLGSGQINANGASQAAFGSFSDSRLKENIVSLPSQLANILSLRPVEFDYKDGSGHQIGFVAQEMQEVYSDAVGEQNGFLTVTGWSKTEARLVSAIKELAAKVQALEAKLA